MNRRNFDRGVFLLEGLNSLGTTLYFNYLFFFLKNHFAFTNKENLLVGALNGFIYVPCAILGGKIGQKRGYLYALRLGLTIMCVAMAVSWVARTVTGQLAGMCIWTVGMCFTWPNLEALACDRQPTRKLPGIIGIYNVVWSGTAAISYFTGGAVAEALGWRSIFWIPLILHGTQIAIIGMMQPASRKIFSAPAVHADGLHDSHPQGPLFLKMAWLANPFAYIAINATIPLIPDLAARFRLTPAFAGFFCSIWFFARTLTFAALAFWSGWHYRFRYMMGAYIGMVAAFMTVLLAPNFYLVVAAQLLFGWCIGLIYYSSLYYSMHVGETKGEHGGFHEAAIGMGIFGGPAIGAASIFLAPGRAHSSIFGVGLVISAGFGALLLLRLSARRKRRADGEILSPDPTERVQA